MLGARPAQLHEALRLLACEAAATLVNAGLAHLVEVQRLLRAVPAQAGHDEPPTAWRRAALLPGLRDAIVPTARRMAAPTDPARATLGNKDLAKVVPLRWVPQ